MTMTERNVTRRVCEGVLDSLVFDPIQIPTVLILRMQAPEMYLSRRPGLKATMIITETT
jgi:hypothetical protein